jgi:Na+-driven multidrug efflux pump
VRTFIAITFMMSGFAIGALISLFVMGALTGTFRSIPPVFVLVGALPLAVLFDRLTPRILAKVEERYWPLLGVVGAAIAVVLFIVAWGAAGRAER